MKETDFRLGITILDNQFNETEVITIDVDTLSLIMEIQNFDSFSGILITEERLLKLGCQIRYKFLFDLPLMNDNILLIHKEVHENENKDRWLIKINAITSSPIAVFDYVHELQSLILDLTDELLIYKND